MTKDLKKRLEELLQRAGGSLSLTYTTHQQMIADFAKELEEASAVYVQFRHIPEQRESEWLGPFRFAQMTYDTVQVEDMKGELDQELATYDQQSGCWFTSFGGPAQYEQWTDVVISPRGA
jgi:hypothetical protein